MESKILLVDDEKDIIDLIEDVLRQDGFQSIQKSYTGMDALKACKEFQPDVVVLDIMLPDIDGIEVCKRLREIVYRIKAQLRRQQYQAAKNLTAIIF